MANIQVLDEATGERYTVTISLQSAVLVGSGSGGFSNYIKMATSRPNPDGVSTPAYVITEFDTGETFTTPVQSLLVVLMDYVSGGLLRSSSSSQSSSVSSQSSSSHSSSSLSSQSSISSQS